MQSQSELPNKENAPESAVNAASTELVDARLIPRIRRAQRAVMFVCLLLIASQVMALLFALIGFGVGLLGGAATIVVSWFATRKAKASASSTAWFILPPLIFTVIPLVLKFLLSDREESLTLQMFLLSNLPFVLGFLLPVVVLLAIYWRMAKLIEMIVAK